MAAGINATDSVQERLTKVLPADVTAAFISADQAFKAALDPPEASTAIVWSFVAILLLCPVYFWFVSGIRNRVHIAFLCTSFIVFAVAIASTPFDNVLRSFLPNSAVGLIQPIAIGLPILWAFIISNIFVHWIGDRIAAPSGTAPAPATAPAPTSPVPGTPI